MAKRTVSEEAETNEEVVRTVEIKVNDQSGNLVQIFDNTEEAYAFAGENGYQVNIG